MQYYANHTSKHTPCLKQDKSRTAAPATHLRLHLPPPLASHASAWLSAMPYMAHTLGHTQLQQQVFAQQKNFLRVSTIATGKVHRRRCCGIN
jgi:hypothetical protein